MLYEVITNRLINETSPYLLQHAHNPVDWYPWSEEALARARQDDKPILLSIGYSACHWCHVMEHESFEDKHVARIMNDKFLCIKVDREERPDLDKIVITSYSIHYTKLYDMACAASSITRRPCSCASSYNGSRSTGRPAKCTGTIARVRAVMVAAAAATSILKVCGSTSTSTGRPPASTMALSVAAKVRGVVMTSSPSRKPSASNAKCRPAVAEEIV